MSERGVSNTLSCIEEYHKMCEYLDDLAGRISKKPDERDVSNKSQPSTNRAASNGRVASKAK